VIASNRRAGWSALRRKKSKKSKKRRVSAESAVDLMEAKSSAAERRSRGFSPLSAARRRRALDRLSAAEKERFHEVDGAQGRLARLSLQPKPRMP
jgi:hypothetical protein